MASTTLTTVGSIQAIIDEAQTAAHAAAGRKHDEIGDRDVCGFVWVTITAYNGKKLDGRNKMAKLMKQAGIGQDHLRRFRILNPGKFPTQSISVLEAGALAAADCLRSYGFEASAESRLD